MVPFIILLSSLLFLLKSYKKAIIVITILGVFIDGFFIGGISVYSYLSLLALFLLPFHFKNVNIKLYPFLFPSILLFSSLLLTELILESNHFPSVIMRTVSNVAFPFLIWVILKYDSNKNLQYFLKVSLWVALIISLYSFFECISKSNPFVDQMSKWGVYPYSYDLQMRFGLKRTYTFFTMHITNGAVSLGLFLILLYAKQNFFLKGRNIYIILILLVINIFATGSRAIILSFMVFLLFFLFQYFKLSVLFKTCIIGIFLFSILGTYIDTIIGSFLNTDSVEGSNIDMREEQINLALYFLYKSFWFGNGIGSIGYVLTNYREMMGAESIWIPVMVEQGMLGIISIASIFIFSIMYVFKQQFFSLIWIPIGFLILFTMTSVPNCQPTCIWTIIVVLSTIHKQVKKIHGRN